MEMWNSFANWFLSLGESYGVNPVIFGSLYVGTIPLFTITLGWVLKNIKHKKPIFLPLMLSGLFFISAYLYVIVVGKNIPYWVYIFIAIMIIAGLAGAVQKLLKAGR